MIIITLERRTLDGKPVEQDALENNTDDYRDWWCKIETEEEQIVHDLAIENGGEHLKLWNYMVKHAGQPQGLCWGDDDVYGYLTSDEAEPEVGEEYTDGDGDIWVRVE